METRCATNHCKFRCILPPNHTYILHTHIHYTLILLIIILCTTSKYFCSRWRRERDKGKRRGEDEDEEVFKERWVRESDQVVSQLYFFVSLLYQPIILNMHPKNLPFMF